MLKKTFVLTAVMLKLGVAAFFSQWLATPALPTSEEMLADCPWCYPDPNCGSDPQCNGCG
ncbi:MAG: hypothetical protein O2968_06620 [Acidobacteria bacterium]|nr:hypothetical protein [Acidobacteriota bacterium]